MKVGSLWFVRFNFTIYQLACCSNIVSGDYVDDRILFVVIRSGEIPLGNAFEYKLVWLCKAAKEQ